MLQADPGLDGLSDKDDMNSPALVDPLVQVCCLGIGGTDSWITGKTSRA